jgi:hypothetical protein
MSEQKELSELDIREAHDAAAALLSDKFRPYLKNPMLPTLLSKFRDDALDALGMELPPRLPLRVKHQSLDMLTDAELEAMATRVGTLLGKFTSLIDDPALLHALIELREDLCTERGDRNILRAAFGKPAEAS